jgi:cardiolipin synthase
VETFVGFLPDLSTWASWARLWHVGYWVALGLAVLSIPSVLLQRRGRPVPSVAWLLVLLAYPPVGLVAWWGFGRYHMERKRRRRRRARAHVAGRLAVLHETLPDHTQPRFRATRDGGPLVHARHLLLDRDDGVFPTRHGNRLQILWDGSAFYPALEAAIRGARHHIHFQFYIWQNDETGRRFRDLLAEKAREGVEVRALYDAVGGSPVSGRFMKPLRAAGGQAAAFLPLRFLTRRLTVNFRNHRKIVIVDGETGFIGGLNIGREYAGRWHDLALQMEGPVVDQLQEVFAEDWYFATGEDLADRAYFGRHHGRGATAPDGSPLHRAVCRVIASGPDMKENATHQAFFVSINSAAERVYIATPYLVPDQAILMALRAAAMRGVDVRLMLPAESDLPFVQLAARSYYDLLLDAGVRIFEYQGAIMHTKLLLFDRDWTAVGSANMDIRSFRLNFEAGCFIYSPSVNAALTEAFERDLARSAEVTVKERSALSRLDQLAEAAAHLFSPLL